MRTKTGKNLIKGILLLAAAVMLFPMLQSCGNSTDNTPNANNTQLLIANFSPDALPVNFFLNNLKQNTSAYYYPTPSSYFYMNYIGLQLQFRASGGTQSTIAHSDSITNRNTKYSLFLTGMAIDSSLTTIFMVDTSSIPKVGSGKLRFVNASPRSGTLDVYANGTEIFDNIQYTTYSKFLEMPAGNYDIKIYNHGDQSTVLKEINPLTVQDGRLYSLASYGIVGRTDTAAFSATLIVNK